MPEEKKPVDAEMSAAGKIRAARQPRQAGGKFASTTNAQEQEVIGLKARIEGDRKLMADAAEKIRLLESGNKRLTEERNDWKGRTERQLDTIRGDRRQINTLKAEIDALQGVAGNLTHDRDAMTAEVDRLTIMLAAVTSDRDDLKAQWGEQTVLLRKAQDSKTFAQFCALAVCVLSSGVILSLVVMGGAR